MLWWLGAVALLVMAIPCGLTLGAKMARGEVRLWRPSVAAWLFGWHALVGVAGFWMITRAGA